MKIYADGTKEPITYVFLIFALPVLILLIYLLPYGWQNYQADLEKSGRTIFNIIFYGAIYFLVAFVFFMSFVALFYGFLYSFFKKIILIDNTIILKEIFKKTEINLKDITHFAIGKVDIPIVYSTGYGPMGSISGWDYPAIYYKKDQGLIRLILPWLRLDDFIKGLGEKAPWIQIKIPKKYLD